MTTCPIRLGPPGKCTISKLFHAVDILYDVSDIPPYPMLLVSPQGLAQNSHSPSRINSWNTKNRLFYDFVMKDTHIHIHLHTHKHSQLVVILFGWIEYNIGNKEYNDPHISKWMIFYICVLQFPCSTYVHCFPLLVTNIPNASLSAILPCFYEHHVSVFRVLCTW